jgi:TonB-linked SusC/RagA family outer membrane protein
MTPKPFINAKWLLSLLGCLLLMASVNSIQAQSVSGTVVSATDNQPLNGVTVQLEGSTRATATDGAGHYSLSNVSANDSLTFSFVGFEPQTVATNGRTTINISLKATASSLDQVVVVGYGTQKKVNLTGSVSTISAKDLSVVPAASVSTLLAGKLPGLIAVQRSGEPGQDDAGLTIRGFGPALVVVDGIPGRDFTRLDPSEIESITVLKDAASAAVYGVSGGNGVILVTTKRGTVGKPELNYQFNYGLQHVTRYPKFVNSEQYVTLKNEASVNSGGPILYTPEVIEKYRQGTDPQYPNFDYYDYFVHDYTPQVQQNISVRGGSKNIQYYFLLGGINQASMWKVKGDPQDYKNYNFKSNVDARINDDLDISVDFSANSQYRNSLIQSAYLMSSWLQYQWPIFAPTTPDGKIASTNYGLVAYLDRDLTGYVKDNFNTFQGSLSLNYKIPFVPGLSAKATFARDIYYDNTKNWLKKYYTYTWDEATQESIKGTPRGTDELTLYNMQKQITHIQTSLNYTKSIAEKHNINALLLYEESEFDSTNFSANRQGYVVPIDQIFAGPSLNQLTNGGAADDGRQSLVGRLNYDFEGKYLFEYSFRYDGSPRFPPATRWGYFSGISGGWRLSEENFIKDNFSAINNLKLRLSWGKLGNDVTGKFQYLTGYNYPSQTYILGGNTVTSGMTSKEAPNPNITWETSETYNAGLDLDMWGRLLGATVDVFYRKRSGILAKRSLQLPSTYGDLLPDENLNSDHAKGFELVLNHSYHLSEVHYDISANFNYTKTRWDHVESKIFSSDYDNWKNNQNGRNENILWALNAIGQFQSQEEINSSPIQDGKQNSTLRPGDIKFEDFNKDGVIDGDDNIPIGRNVTAAQAYPEITYGFSINLNWKKFGMIMNWQGAANLSVLEDSYLIHPFNNGMNAYAYFMDRWHLSDLSDPNSAWIPGKYPSTINAGAPNNKQVSSFWLKNAAYLRLKSFALYYTIDTKSLKKIGLEKVDITLSGQNLLTFTGLDYIDPEAPSGRLSYYPQQLTYNAGINVTF